MALQPAEISAIGGPLAAVGYRPPVKRHHHGFGPVAALEDIGAAIGAGLVTAATGGALAPEASLGTLAVIGAGAGAATQAGLTGRPGGVLQALTDQARAMRSAREQPVVARQPSAPAVRRDLLPSRQERIPVLREQPDGTLAYLGHAQPGSEELATLLARQPASPAAELPVLARQPEVLPATQRAITPEQPAESGGSLLGQQPCPDCGVTPLPKPCPPELAGFVAQLQKTIECGALEKLVKFQVNKYTGTVTVTARRPVCICADDVSEIQLWAQTGGAQGDVSIIDGGLPSGGANG